MRSFQINSKSITEHLCFKFLVTNVCYLFLWSIISYFSITFGYFFVFICNFPAHVNGALTSILCK